MEGRLSWKLARFMFLRVNYLISFRGLPLIVVLVKTSVNLFHFRANSYCVLIKFQVFKNYSNNGSTQFFIFAALGGIVLSILREKCKQRFLSRKLKVVFKNKGSHLKYVILFNCITFIIV